jgi:hypothetical protein
MKLTREQVKEIEDLLEKDKIFYEDIRLEMVDHIASHLEETLSGHDDFRAVLKQYMNSHHKVKLLTAAREQERIQDVCYKKAFISALLKFKSVLTWVLLSALVYLCYPFFGLRIVIDIIMLGGMFISIGLFRRFGNRFDFIIRVSRNLWLPYAFVVLVISRVFKILGRDNPTAYIINAVAVGLLFTAFILFWKLDIDFKKKRYA